MLFGAHVSVAGGLQNAVIKGTAIGAQVLQIFVSPPQSFKTTGYSDKQIGEFKQLYQDAGFSGLFLHAVYLINLASPNKDAVDRSIASLVHYLNMGDKLGAVGTIVHLGSFGKSNDQLVIPAKAGIYLNRSAIESGMTNDTLIDSIKQILSQGPSSQKLIIENCAGSKIGKNLDELVEIYERVNSSRIEFCIDTQHLFASGIDVRDSRIFAEWLTEFDTRIGTKRLACVHANDSKSDLGSGLDRHENIGEGKIGEAGFKNILRQPLLQNKPFILETPGENREGPNKENLERIKSYFRQSI